MASGVGVKRKLPMEFVDSGVSDFVEITPLGSGREVGRSCHLIKYKNKQIMLDCGVHPALRGEAAMPFFDAVDLEKIDLLLISHFHLDHAACLPYFLEKTKFKGRVFMTHPTKSIYKLILQDFVKVSNLSIEQTLFTEKELMKSMPKIETVQYHQVRTVNGIKFTPFAAGHVLGAAMFLIEIAGVKLLYTGDYSREEDRHLMQAEIPPVCPDILIMEATFGTQTLPPIQDRESMLCEAVHKVVRNGGRVLIPVFALGRAQELLLIIDEYWQKHPELHHIPIFYAGVLAKKCIAVYQTFSNMMNIKMQDAMSVDNPFDFKHVRNLKSRAHFEDHGPCVVFASPGMLQNGFSRELFESWCNDPRNGLIVAGYSVQGTMAKHVLTNPSEVEALSGVMKPLNMKVHYIRFAAHADFEQHREFIAALRPHHIILVHGESNEMRRMQDALERIYQNTQLRITGPSNCQKVEIEIRRNKIVKTLGSLAANAPKEGEILRGLIVRKDFNHLLLAPEDLSEFTSLMANSISQELVIDFRNQTLDSLKNFLSRIYDVKDSGVASKKKRRVLKVLDMVSIVLAEKEKHLTLSWVSGPIADMIADSVVSMVSNMQVNADPAMAKSAQKQCQCKFNDPIKNFQYILTEHFGADINFVSNNSSCTIKCDGKTAKVLFEKKLAKRGRSERIGFKVECEDPSLKRRLRSILTCVEGAIFPLSWADKKKRKKKPRVTRKRQPVKTEGTVVEKIEGGVKVKEEQSKIALPEPEDPLSDSDRSSAEEQPLVKEET